MEASAIFINQEENEAEMLVFCCTADECFKYYPRDKILESLTVNFLQMKCRRC